MKRTFCDFCDALIEGGYNGATILDEETRFRDRNVTIRLELRNDKDKQDKLGITRPDICFDCRKAIVLRLFGANEK